MITETFAELMARRIALVEKLSALNAKQVLNTQTRSGIEIELLGCIEAIERDGETTASRTHRTELEMRFKEAAAAWADCDRDLDTLADQLNTLDQRLSEL